MTIIEKVWEYIDSNEAFYVHLNDGRKYFVKDFHWIGSHPSRKGTNVTIYGPGEDEEHFVPVYAISSITRNDTSPR
jgi:hypothetical protein